MSLHAAVIDLCASGVRVRHTAFEERGQRTSTFASGIGAQVAINGDWSCRPVDVGPNTEFEPCRGLPAYVTYGVAAHAGRIWPDSPEQAAMLAFAPGRVEAFDWQAHADAQPWMSEIISGHFQLVRDGAIAFEARDGNPNAYGPRSAIGLSQDRTRLVLAVVDGRNGRRGMNEAEIAAVLVELGAHSGFGLDGGGSSTLWMDGRGVLNEPSDGVERIVGPHLAVFADGATAPLHCDRPWTPRDGVGLGSIETIGSPGGFHPITPRRLYDTRNPSLSAGLSDLQRVGGDRIAAQTAFRLDDMGRAGIPAGASAASVVVTVVDPQSEGFITLWSGDRRAPDTSVLNHAALQNRANSALIGFQGDPGMRVYSYAEAHHLADLTGTFGEGGAGLVAEAATRVLDTRQSSRLEANEARQIVAAVSDDERAVALSVVVVDPQSDGFVTIYPCQDGVPDVSNANFRRGETIAASVIVASGRSGVCARSSTATHLIVDRFARFENGRGALFQAVTPHRLVDSRRPNGRWSGRIPAGTVAELDFADLGGFPEEAVAVSLNVTAVHAAENGFAALGRCDQPSPGTSTINVRDGETVAVAATAVLHDRKVCLFSHARSHYLVDISGYYVPREDAPPPVVDAGPIRRDSGSAVDRDAMSPTDAKVSDGRASVDIGAGDSGPSDGDAGGVPPGGTTPPPGPGCSCSGGRGALLDTALLILALVALRRRRLHA